MALSYTWTQVSGPAVTIANPTAVKLELKASEVVADNTAQFKVVASAGAFSADATVAVKFANIAQTPTFLEMTLADYATRFTENIRLFAGDKYGKVIGFSPDSASPISLMEYPADSSAVVTGQLPPDAFVKAARFPGWVYDAGKTQVLVGEPDRLRLLRRNASGYQSTPFGYELYIDFPTERVCAANQSFMRSHLSQVYLFAGQRKRGLTVFGISDTYGGNPTYSKIIEINNGKSYCAISAVEQAILPTGTGGVTPLSLPDLIAIDTDNNTIDLYVEQTYTSYRLKSQTPIQLDSAKPLKFVAAADLDTTFTKGLALVFTDGEHAGQHRLVIVGEDGGGNIVQETHAWSLGVPVDVVVDNLNRDNFNEVIVIPSSSPQAVVFETANPTGPRMFPLSPVPKFIQIGLGAVAALPAAAHDALFPQLYIAYSEKRGLRQFMAP